MLIEKNLSTLAMDYSHGLSIMVPIVRHTVCLPGQLLYRPTRFILFVKYTNCGWGHLFGRLNERDGLSGGEGTRIEVSHIRFERSLVVPLQSSLKWHCAPICIPVRLLFFPKDVHLLTTQDAPTGLKSKTKNTRKRLIFPC